MAEYIDRQAAIDAMESINDSICGQQAIDALCALPSADVQPVRHGKWIKAQRKGITSYGDGFAECNKCHEVSYLGWNDKYCRNCGADMRGDNDV